MSASRWRQAARGTAIAVMAMAAAAPAVRGQTRPAAGTGQVAGVVVSSGSSEPVRRAIVTLASSDDPHRSTVSDDQGRFVFTGLPAGRFTLSASKPAWLVSAYGAKGPGRPGTAIVLAAGQTMTDLRLVIARGAVLSGVVRDASGTPQSGVSVFAAAVAATSTGVSGPSPLAGDTITTDDRGVYRIYGLDPGTYYVVALATAAPGTGDIEEPSSDDVDATLRDLQQRATSSVPSPPAARRRAQTVNFAPVFHPSAIDVASATAITLAAGDERDDVDVVLSLVPTASIDGQVVSPTGDVPPLQVSISRPGPVLPALLTYRMQPTLAGQPGADGVFHVTNVPPGTFTISARSSNRRIVTTTTNGLTSTRTESVPIPSGGFLWGATDVTVNGDDLTGVRVNLRPGLTVAGTVAFDAPAGTPAPDPAAVRLALGPPRGAPMVTIVNNVSSGPLPIGASATVRPDGTFLLEGLVPGEYEMTATVGGNGGAGWWLRSVMSGTRDLLDAPFQIGDTDLAGLVVTLSSRHTALNGSLQTPGGQPAPGFVVIAFPADRTLWMTGSRRIVKARPGTDGRFGFADLPPGDYLLAAATDLPDDWQTPDFLGQVAAAGVPVTLGEGETKNQDLRIAGGGPQH